MRSGRVGALLAAAVIVAPLSSCSTTTDDDTLRSNERIAERIGDDLRASGRFTQVRTGYTDDVDNEQTLFLRVTCVDCRPAQALDDLLRLAWESRVSPLRTLTVSAFDTTSGREAREDMFLEEKADVLERTRKYGVRPVASTNGSE